MTLPTTYAERKALPLWDYLFGYFFDAFLAEVDVSVEGNKQHNPGEPLHWAREKSTDQLNTALRHQADYATGVKRDVDGCWHLAKAIWRLKAQLQLDIEAERREIKPLARQQEANVPQKPPVFDPPSNWEYQADCPCTFCAIYRSTRPGAIEVSPVSIP